MARELAWVGGLPAGRLALLARPRPDDWLESDITAWARAGVSTVVSLLEPGEVRDLGLGQEAALCHAQGIEFLSLPIPDRGLPASRRAFMDLVERLHTILRNGGTVAVHCRAGIGRTGLLAGCLLARLEVPFGDIFDRLSRDRGVAMPDTLDQMEWVRQFSLALPRSS